MTSYGLTPDNISDKFPVGPAFGPPNYSIIHNNGMDTRPLNQFDKTFQSTIQNERDNQLGTAFVGGKGKGRRTRKVRWNKKRRIHNNRPHMKRTLTKKRRLTKNKKTHTHTSHLSRKSKSRSKKSILRRLFFGRGEPIGYTMDTKNTDSLHGALATPYNMTGYE
jgi:hypothetical protein